MPTSEATLISHFIASFVGKLREAGISISLSQTLNFSKSLVEVADEKNSAIYWAGRVCLLSNPRDIVIYDVIYDIYYRSYFEDSLANEEWLEEIGDEDLAGDDIFDDAFNDAAFDDAAKQLEKDIETVTIRYSPNETLYEKDFKDLTPAELDEARQIISQMALTAPLKISRRFRASKNKSAQLDIREMTRRSIQTDGEPIRQAFLQPRQTNRRIVLLLDISSSMETYARIMLRFAHSCILSQNKTEVFTISTRLTRITKELLTKDPDLAFSQAAASVEDWSGGTRLGEGLESFNNQWGLNISRGAVVMILSDGWDRGDSLKLSEQMARLSRVAKRIIWVNPLKATDNYEPLAQGMAAALPWVDDFVEGHSLYALKNLAELTKTN